MEKKGDVIGLKREVERGVRRWRLWGRRRGRGIEEISHWSVDNDARRGTKTQKDWDVASPFSILSLSPLSVDSGLKLYR